MNQTKGINKSNIFFTQMTLDMCCSTYHAGPVAAAEMAISIRSLARAIRAALMTAVAGPEDGSGLNLWGG